MYGDFRKCQTVSQLFYLFCNIFNHIATVNSFLGLRPSLLIPCGHYLRALRPRETGRAIAACTVSPAPFMSTEIEGAADLWLASPHHLEFS
jgi:hypothetical protein